MTSRQTIEIEAGPEYIFELSQDYSKRLDWDPFLKVARLIDGASRAGVGVKAWCVARSGLGMETRYVSFHPPGVCAVEMTQGPWFLRSFAGSWRFEPVGPERTRVVFTYGFVGRPTLLTPLLAIAFARDTRHRLEALKRAIERRPDSQIPGT